MNIAQLSRTTTAPSTSAHLDALLECLVEVAAGHGQSMSRAAAIAGLPLDDGILTLDAFPRAAERVGLSSLIGEYKIPELSELLLPAILCLSNDRFAVLHEGVKDGVCVVSMPGVFRGRRTYQVEKLTGQYTGTAAIVKPLRRPVRGLDEATVAQGGHWFWGTVSRLRGAYTQIVLAAALVNILALASPLFVMNVYDRVLPNKAITTLWVLAAGMALAVGFDFAFRLLRNGLIGHTGRRADLLLARQIYSHVMRLDLAQRPVRTGEYVSQLRNFEHVREFFTSNSLVAIADIAFIGLFIFIIHLIGGPVAYIPLAAVFLVLCIGLALQFPLARAVQGTEAEGLHRQTILYDSVTGLETIRTAGAEGQMQSRWEKAVGRSSQVSDRLRALSSLGTNLTATIQQLVTVGIILVGVYLFKEGEITPGALIASVILGGRAVAPLGLLAATMTKAQQALHAYRALNRIMQENEEVDRTRRYIDQPITAGHISLQEVTFNYPQSEVSSLCEISLQIRPGERVGIIGRIGSGKTTLCRLLSRLYLPSSGALRIDGLDVSQYHPAEVRRRLVFVSQDATLFHGTLRENVALGLPQLPDNAVIHALELCGLMDLVNSHPQGLDMPVGEAGRMLSSGQRQALLLARAFVRDPAVLLLDEPSACLDQQSERELVARLKSVIGPKQSLVVATHRTAPLELVDRLVVMDRGKILADGPKKQVLQGLSGRAVKHAHAT